MLINWLPHEAITILSASRFTVVDFTLANITHYKHTEYYKAGEWYRLTVELLFQRRYGFYILQVIEGEEYK